MDGNDTPLVSICCPTYNHGDYIAKALDGFLMQKVNFSIEIIVHDDASTDKTSDIIRAYEKQHTQIRAVIQSENLMSKGLNPTIDYCLLKARGKYIALCEGDDYWTDSLKLQRQVDFLEANNDFVISCHNSNIVDTDGNFIKKFNEEKVPAITNTNYILKNGWYIPTASIVFRNENLKLPYWFYNGLNGDYMLQLILTSKGGKVDYKDEVKSSYRIHKDGLSNTMKGNSNNYSMIYINTKFNKYSNGQYSKIIKENIWKFSFRILNNIPVFSKTFFRVMLKLIWTNNGLTFGQTKELIKLIIKK